MGGSQLKQLKSSLSDAGLSRQSVSKKRKRSSVGSANLGTPSSSAPNGTSDSPRRPGSSMKISRGAKLQDVHDKLNPFDVKVTKLKHEVGGVGKKVRGVMGRPGMSKQVGIDQRKKTLLVEYEKRSRVGGILDRRFGENDPTMTPEDRMLERFTRERQRAAKASNGLFNLDDGADEGVMQYGQSLGLDDFDDGDLGLRDEDSDDANGRIDRRTVAKDHFGGFEDDDGEGDEDGPPRKKSKSEVMSEVIAKSKEHKYLRQLEREKQSQTRHELDQEFDSIRSLLLSAPRDSDTTQSGPTTSLPLLNLPPPTERRPNDIGERKVSAPGYDELVADLKFDRRSKAKERTKTDEEIALEEREALEKAERKRVRRMNGDEDVDSSDEEVERRRKRKRAQDRGGDDLEDDFDHEVGELGIGLGEKAEDMNDEGESEDGKEELDPEADSESTDVEDEDEGDEGSPGSEPAASDDFRPDEGKEESSASDAEEMSEPASKSAKISRGKRENGAGSSKELPFTFPCPATHEEFLEILDGVREEDVGTVVQRIRVLYHSSLAEENKLKLQTLISVLIEHVLHITAPPAPNFSVASELTQHIFALSETYPIPSALGFTAKLSLMHKNLSRGLAAGATAPSSRTFPGPSELALLRVIGTVWSTSDLNHAVIGPARLLMGAYLALGRVRSLKDIGSGLFLCTLFLQYEAMSKRLVPEAINFLIDALLHLAPNYLKESTSLPGSFPAADFNSPLCLPLRIFPRAASKLAFRSPNLVEVLCSDYPERKAAQIKLDLIGDVMELLDNFADMYKGLECFIELFQPVLDVINGLNLSGFSVAVEARFAKSKDILTRLLRFATRSRRHLRLQAHKPIPLSSHIPKFSATLPSTSASRLRSDDPDRERNEAAKLRAALKSERKGAVRELRKDARFLAGVREKKKAEEDKGYKDRMSKVWAGLEGERAEQKKEERAKARDKKRAGK